MQITRAAAERVFAAIGFSTAEVWSDTKLAGKLNKVNSLVDDNTKLTEGTTKEDEANLDAVIAAIKKGKTVELAEDAASSDAAEAEPETAAPEEKPARKAAAKKAAKAVPKAAVKKAVAKHVANHTAAKKAAPKEKKEPSKGVIAHIIEYLEDASEKKPITKAQILAKLAKQFPDKVAEVGHGMHTTVTVQVPHRLREDRKLKIQDNSRDGKKPVGYWLPVKK